MYRKAEGLGHVDLSDMETTGLVEGCMLTDARKLGSGRKHKLFEKIDDHIYVASRL